MNEREIFDAALQISSAEARSAFLHQACGNDDRLREQVEGLLRAEQQLGSFLAAPLPAFAPTITESPLPEKTGTQIGPYKLLEQIGEGGFGIVFMAEQQHPVRRRVALKVLKPGMDTRQVIARFEAERQALALMDHPHIAKVFDAGATDSGRPYFVMELVKGVTITEYCDANRLTPRERLELFVAVCQAVQHAHQKGIIHRDIKPSNVLVTKHDGVPVVKVIDFGVAKALGQQLTDKTVFTAFAQMIGTPLYMSPEQAEFSGLDVDTRTDVYALGVLLYELLTGTTPFDRERLKSAAFDEIRRIIREEEPQKPSTRLSSLSRVGSTHQENAGNAPHRKSGGHSPTCGTSLASIAALRKMEPRRLSQLVRGDLDWIVMRALEKDRNRRYETANGFALDIQRYLADEPVSACPPSAVYRFRKFARRNNAAFAIGSIVAAALIVAVVASAVSNTLVRRESAAKEEALQTARLHEELAKQHAATAEKERKNAARNEAEAKAQAQLARRRLYVAQMDLARQAWEQGNPARVLDLLENQRPTTEQDDLRGFEWYYLWRQCHSQRRLSLKHPGVRCIAGSPDGKLLASGSSDSTVKIWELANGRELVCFRGDGSLGVFCITFSPDSTSLAAGVADGTIRLWDVDTFRENAPLKIHDRAIRSLAYALDGRTLAAGMDNGTVKLWESASGRALATLEGHSHTVMSLAFSPDNRTLATASDWIGTKVKLWDLTSNPPQVTRDWDGGDGPVAFFPEGTKIVMAKWEEIEFWNAATGQKCGDRAFQAAVTSLSVSPDGDTLAFGLNNRTLHLWNPRTGRQSVMAHGQPVTGVVFTADGKTVACTGGDRIGLWNTGDENQEVTLQAYSDGCSYASVAYSPDNKTLAFSAADGVKLYNAASRLERTTIEGRGEDVRAMEFSRDSRLLAIGRMNGPKVWDITAMHELANVDGGPQNAVVVMALAPGGQTLAYGGEALNGCANITLLDTGSNQIRTILQHGGPVCAAIFSPEGKSLILGLPGIIEFWNSETYEKERSFRVPNGWIEALAVSSDGKTLVVSGTSDARLRSFDSGTGRPLATFQGHTASVRALDVFPDGDTLVSGSFDGTIKFWDMSTGQERFSFVGHQGFKVTSVTVAPDGKSIATAAQDGTVRLWRTADDEEASSVRTERFPDEPDTPAVQVNEASSPPGSMEKNRGGRKLTTITPRSRTGK